MSIRQVFSRHFGAEIVPADSADEAVDRLQEGPFQLVLVNRILDADGGSGVDVIRRFRGDKRFAKIPVMLVSNHDDAQREAMNAGAVRGFGKSSLGHADMIARVQPYFNESA
jgi:CheY-like chemotaxis protein